MQPHKEGFFGAFTRDGYMLYDPVMFLDNEIRGKLIIKGGTYRLRSSLILQITKHLQKAGYEADIMSSVLDTDSAHCVVSPRLGFVAMLEDDCALSPRVIPDSADSHYVFADFDEALTDTPLLLPCDEDGESMLLPTLRQESLSNERRACRLIEAAAILKQDAQDEWEDQLVKSELERLLEPWIQTITAFREPSPCGHESHFFAEAVTSQGIVKRIGAIEMPRTWRITGPFGANVSGPLSRLRDAALSRGMDVLCASDIISPDMLSHILIPDLGLFITSEEDTTELRCAAQRTIDLRSVMPTHDLLSQNTLRAIAFDEMMYAELLERAAFCLDLSMKARLRIDAFIEKRIDEAKAAAVTARALEMVEKIITNSRR